MFMLSQQDSPLTFILVHSQLSLSLCGGIYMNTPVAYPPPLIRSIKSGNEKKGSNKSLMLAKSAFLI